MIEAFGQSQRKGQSAIEYLTTYGWMLLVVAIVGGAIFTTVQGQADLQAVSGFSGSDVGIGSFGTTGDQLALEVQSQGSNPISVNRVTLTSDSTGNTVSQSVSTGRIPLGSSETVLVENVTTSEASNTFTLGIEYETGNLPGLLAEGTITGNFRITNSTTT